MNKIIMLNIEFSFSDVKDVIHPVILCDKDNIILVDCGYTGFLPKIEQALMEHTISCKELTHVLITHQDHDHMGALYDLKIKYPHIKVVSSIEEAPYISGDLKSLRLEQAERLQEYLPNEQKEFGLRFCNILKSVKAVAVDIEVKNGDFFDWCGGCIILETPGHTNGHISLYLKEEKVLITGDAAAIENGELVIANPQFTLDIDKAEESLKKIKSFGAEKIICYHGGLYIPKNK